MRKMIRNGLMQVSRKCYNLAMQEETPIIQILSVSDMAQEIGITPNRVRELIRLGRIKGVQRVGREFAITRPDFEAFLKIPRKAGRPRKHPQTT